MPLKRWSGNAVTCLAVGKSRIVIFKYFVRIRPYFSNVPVGLPVLQVYRLPLFSFVATAFLFSKYLHLHFK